MSVPTAIQIQQAAIDCVNKNFKALIDANQQLEKEVASLKVQVADSKQASEIAKSRLDDCTKNVKQLQSDLDAATAKLSAVPPADVQACVQNQNEVLRRALQELRTKIDAAETAAAKAACGPTTSIGSKQTRTATTVATRPTRPAKPLGFNSSEIRNVGGTANPIEFYPRQPAPHSFHVRFH